MVDHRHRAHALLEQEGASFAVNVLGEDQAELSNRFAWVKTEDRFAVGDWTTAKTGAPVLKTALAWIDCEIYSKFKAGSHTVYIGKACQSGVGRPDGKPLVYWNRGYRKLQENVDTE